MTIQNTFNQEWHSVKSWAAIVGLWKFDTNGEAVYVGPQGSEWPYGICVSDVRFSEGEARVTVTPSKEIDGRILLGYRSPSDDYFAVGLGGYGDAYTLTHFSPNTGWRELVGAGRSQNLPFEMPYQVSVRVHGQRVILEVDKIRVLDYVLPVAVPYGQFGLFAWGKEGNLAFSNAEVSVRGRGDAFVVMQFSGFEELYEDVIQPVVKDFGLRPYRADEVFGPGNILEDIVRGIETAQVVIAEVTPPNENVFYEVGYAHALRKPTILLADKTKKLPFDLSGYRCLFYENSIGGKRKVEEGLRHHLKAILHE